jgi:hypothetical protein
MVASEVLAIVLVVVERRIPAIVSIAVGHQDLATVPAVAAEVTVVECKVDPSDIAVAGPEAGLRSVGLQVEEKASLLL